MVGHMAILESFLFNFLGILWPHNSPEILLNFRHPTSMNVMRTSSHNLGAYIIVGEDEPLRFSSSSSSNFDVFLLYFLFLVSFY